jgi:Zn-dependent protease with chaperone function/RNA polymerase subunit RPABC4/transcription elongation factor Spt4
MEIRARRRFPRISPASFTHPLDTTALSTLKAIKGLDYITKTVMEYVGQRTRHIYAISNHVMVGPKQCPQLFDKLRLACSVLDMPLPKLYVQYSPFPNAYAYGVTNPMVVLTTGLIDLLEEEEQLEVIAHELGHVLCGHSLYRTMARHIQQITETIGKATLGIGQLLSTGLVYALLEWYRKSEYSADRAGLLVVQDPDVSVNVMMKLAGGTGKLAGSMNREEFLKQAADYDAYDESALNIAYKLFQQVELTHPIPILRAREIVRWNDDMQYRAISDGKYQRRAGGNEACDSCGTTAAATDPYCPHCGQPRASAEGRTADGTKADNHCTSCYAAVPAGLAQCPVCGKAI